MDQLVDAWLWLARVWLGVGSTVAKVVAPSRAAELEQLRCAVLERGPEGGRRNGDEVPVASASDAQDGSTPQACGTPQASRRITSDLVVQDDQDAGLRRLTSCSTAYQSVASANSSLDLGDGASRALTPATSSGMDDLREMQLLKLEDVMLSSNEMKNLLGLLLRSNEDNAVLKSALLATLAKLQATRDELQSTRAELHLTQEQAQLLHEELESAIYPAVAGISDAIAEETGDEIEPPNPDVQRSLDTLLAALQNLHTGHACGDAAGSKTPMCHLASPARSDSLYASSRGPERSYRISSSSPASPNSHAGSAGSGGAWQPMLHLKGVGYRVPLSLSAPQPDRCST